jgi:hypothetical protein
LSEEERKSLDLILGDLRLLIGKDRISVSEIGDLLQKLKSEEAKHYIKSLSSGSKPEQALREFFLARNSPLAKYLFRELLPEVRITHDEARGFIDYVIVDKDTGRTIRLELKALFEAKEETGKTRVLRELRQVPLNPDTHSKQVQKYLSDENAQYVILTNLKDWYFYSKMTFPNVKPFAKLTLDELLQRLEPIGNIFELLVRLEHESVKEELGERFFEDLKRWVGELSKVQFEGDEKTKLELIINLINKFIFIQTLDDYGVIQFNWIKNTWGLINERWRSKGLEEVIKRFLAEVDEWFYSYYDTELFKTAIFNYVKKTPENIQVFYNALKNVLGFAEIPVRGITHYNFRHIDEDVFGRAYETFLAEARKEKGIYYTPKYITQYIVDNTVGRIFDEALEEVKSKLESGRLDEALESIKKFASIKVLDPACGSGSFLIKAFRVIVERYRRLGELIDKAKEKIGGWKTLDPRSRELVEKLEELKKSLGLNNDVALFTKILLRHIYGVDLDERAVEVAKVNLWLEAIKLSPKSFRYDKLGNITHALPNLDLNLRVGDSLVGYAGEAELVLKTLSTSYNLDLLEITTLRSKYIENPGSTDYVDKIKKTMESIKKTLDDMFKKHLEGEKIPTEILNQTKPLHWIIDFWHVFFDEKGNPLPPEQRGFHVIIGNPPYIEYRNIVDNLGKGYVEYLKKTYEYAKEQFDITIPFTERAIKLLRIHGVLSFIMTNKFMITEYGYSLRRGLLHEQVLEEILDVSNIKVFKDAGTYPVVFRVKKVNNDAQYNIRVASLSPTGSPEEAMKNIVFAEVPKQIFTTVMPMYIITPYITEGVLEIFRKFDGRSLREDIVKCGVAQTGFSKNIKKANEIAKEDKNRYILFVQGEDIVPYHVIPSNKYYPLLSLSKEKISDFRQKKIMIPGLLKELYCGYDDVGVGCGRVYYITEKDSPYPLLYLLALFNSSLFKFIYKVVYGMSHLSGDYLRVNTPYLMVFKIKEISNNDLAKKIIETADLIVKLKKARYKFLEIWRDLSDKLSNYKLTLKTILIEDLLSLQKGQFEKTWTTRVSFYPTEQKLKEIAIKRYKKFHIVGDCKSNVIGIYGLDENNVEELVYEMEFVNRELMLHVYCSLVDTLESKAKIETLEDLLEKTMVPVVRGGRFLGELTQNIVRKAIEDFKKWLESEKIQGVDPDIVVVDSEIDDLVARVDAYVFKLYGLTSDEARTILKSLGKSQSYIEKTLRYYTGL